MPGSRKSRRTPPPARADVESLVFRWGAQIDPALLDLALTHRSWAHENGGLPTNERLEFLGDSVLSIVVTENLYRTHPDAPEGQLAKMRAATVSEPALRDALVGDLPFRPLCRPDCRGLCPRCGERLDDLPPGHHHQDRDPRWSVLASLLAQTPQDDADSQGRA